MRRNIERLQSMPRVARHASIAFPNPNPVRRVERLTGRQRAAALALTGAAIACTASLAGAVPFTAVVGYDYASGPEPIISRAVLGVLALGVGERGAVSLVASRYADSEVGHGVSLTGGATGPVGTSTLLRVWGSRYLGDNNYDAWRVKAGPQFQLPGGQSVGLYFSHYKDSQASASDALGAELGMQLTESITGRANASYASVPGGTRSSQGSLGLAWSPLEGFELSGDMGLAQAGAGLNGGPVPAHRRLDPLGLLGNGPPGGTTADGNADKPLSFTALLGVRVYLH